MKRTVKLLSLLLYIAAISAFLNFQIIRLFDIKQIFLVVLGMLLLYLPGLSFDRNTSKNTEIQNGMHRIVILEKLDIQRMGNCAMTASFIQAVVLMLILLFQMDNLNNLLSNVALNFRPILYGMLIWVIARDEEVTSKAKNAQNRDGAGNDSFVSQEKESVWTSYTATASYEIFRSLGLTNRESEVAIQVCKGMNNTQIADELFISVTTVKKHMSNIFEKLEISRREELKKYVK